MTGQPYEQDWEAVPPGTAWAPPGTAWAPVVPPPGPPAQPYGLPAHRYGPVPYGPPGYGPPGAHRPGPYGQPVPWGVPPGWGVVPPAPPAWPHGPGRPPVATAAAVLGLVTGGLTGLVSLLFLVAVLGGDEDAVPATLVLGLPCAAGLVTGGVWLLGRRSPLPLFCSALAAVVVLFLVLVVVAATEDADAVAGFGLFLVFALPLPVLTAVFARLPRTTGWAAGG
ncbi:hypothetical protein SAMN05660464_3809 [Geodermatophilus dictyosporus]|uniref:Uncharacterized protein n=1 Tax=Geodermatophilus dictyosporus TaxID=1523247 RepID=A0A1I5S5U3_9ACTN|nr:hypothetical protein [Geodermatophilus dictyosporus]SFP66011.1 hypothetical protein SAMN05660464_3809 [Geodermatophilus dictyosporus]